MQYELVTAPAFEPVTLEETKVFLRVDVADEDSEIASMISAAREWVEKYTRRALITQTRRLWLDGFDDCQAASRTEFGSPKITIEYPRIQSITSIQYLDGSGVLQTLASSAYRLISRSEQSQGYVIPVYGTPWPITRDEPASVQIDYVAGYTTAAEVSRTIKQAIKLHVGWSFERRSLGEGSIDADQLQSLERLLVSDRVFTF